MRKRDFKLSNVVLTAAPFILAAAYLFTPNQQSSNRHNAPTKTIDQMVQPIYQPVEQLPETKQVEQSPEPIQISYKTSDFSTDTELVLLARMIFGEARSCSPLEKIAVAHTALNRAKDGRSWNGETVKEAILTPWQYSCFNADDPNRNKLADPEKYDARAFEDCLEISRGVLNGKYEDPTKGATHYFNPKVLTPGWAKKLDKIGKIKTSKGKSKHEFYRE